MSIATIPAFMTAITVLLAIAAVVLVGSVLLAAAELIREHRPQRVAAAQPIGRYYRHLALGH